MTTVLFSLFHHHLLPYKLFAALLSSLKLTFRNQNQFSLSCVLPDSDSPFQFHSIINLYLHQPYLFLINPLPFLPLLRLSSLIAFHLYSIWFDSIRLDCTSITPPWFSIGRSRSFLSSGWLSLPLHYVTPVHYVSPFF